MVRSLKLEDIMRLSSLAVIWMFDKIDELAKFY